VTDTATIDLNSASLEELTALRGQHFEAMDEIYRKAEEDSRALTEDERSDYDALRSKYDEVDSKIEEIAKATAESDHARDHAALRSRTVPAIVGMAPEPASANRSLDELYWAGAEDVAAGQYASSGEFHSNPYGARNRVEPTLVRSRENQLVVAPTIDEFSGDHRRLIRAFQRTVGDMIVFGLLTGKRNESLDSASAFRHARDASPFAKRYETLLRAMDVDTAGEGADWVPTGIGAMLHEKVRASGRVAPLFARINMPTNPWKWPLEGADAVAYRVAEPTGDTESKFTASTPGSGGATFDAEIFGARSLFSRSLDSDSAIAVLGFVENKIAQAFSDAEEKAILDGDTDGTHQDSDIGASTTAAVTAWDGLRKKALAQTSGDHSGAALSAAGIRGTRALMGKWGLNPASLAIVVGVSSYFDLLGDTDFRTVDSFGQNAVVLNGQLGAADGIPVVVSEHVREDLNASGVYDGITTNLTYALVVNRGEFAIGQRDMLDIEVDDSVYRETYQRLVIGFQREDFQHIGDATANDDVGILYNVAP
jgi:hypothetical protein